MATKKKTTGRYVIVRTYSAGCFAGVLESRKGEEVVLTQARRLWQWRGAMTLTCLATVGTKDPQGCKFSVPAVRQALVQAIEVIDTTPEARASLEAVPVWSK